MHLLRLLLTLCLLLTASLRAAPQLWIKQHPDPHTLLAKTYSETQPAGYVAATEAEAAAWVDAQLAAGWQPAPQPEPEPTLPTWTDAGDGHTGLVLAVDADSQAKFTADVTAYTAKALAGDLDLDTETAVIRDAAGTEHTLTIRAYLRLIGRLHTALRAQWQSGG